MKEREKYKKILRNLFSISIAILPCSRHQDNQQGQLFPLL